MQRMLMARTNAKWRIVCSFARIGHDVAHSMAVAPARHLQMNVGTLPFLLMSPERYHGRKNCTAMKMVRINLSSCLEHPIVWLEKFLNEILILSKLYGVNALKFI